MDIISKKDIDNGDIQKRLADAWLNIQVDENKLCNPLDWPKEFDETPEKYLAWIMTRPEYFSFICSEVLGIQIIPTQALMLKEMWNRRFPMLIATRGFGKATPLYTDVLTHRGWVNMGDIKIEDKVYGRDGKLHNITGIYPQGKKQICKITFIDGKEIECCEDHLWTVKRQKKEITLSTKDMIKTGTKYKKSKGGGHVYKYKIPNCEPIQYKKQKLLIDPYIMGCLLGDGCLTTNTPKIASNDDFIISEFRNRLIDFKIEKDPTNNNYTIVDQNKDRHSFISKKGKKFYKRSGNRLTTKLRELKINVSCKHKFIPEEYKISSVEDRLEIVRGLLDTDGSINIYGAIEFTNTCERLVDDLIDILRSLGITCVKATDKRAGQKMMLPQGRPFIRKSYFRVFINTSKPIFKLPRKLNRIKKKSTQAEKYVSIVNIEYLNKYTDMQCISVDNEDHTYITKDYIVTHNSFMMSVYALLRILLMENRKVMLAGAAFRQSKVIFDYMEAIYYNSPVLKDIAGNKPIRHDTDMYTFAIGNCTCKAIPIGDGSKIRGQRSNDLLVDEFSSLPQAIFENVLAGFAAVKSHPIDHVKQYASDKLAKELGIYEPPELGDENVMLDNQIIISGTAYYDFNHFAKYWKEWHEIICSQGNPKVLAQFFKKKAQDSNRDDIEVPEGFDWKDYSIIRIPFELVPRGFMDDAQIARSKATIHSGIFQMEFSACSDRSTPIITKTGIKKIIDIKIGDEVLTHKGRFRKVTKKTFRRYNDKIVKIDSYGCYKDMLFTPHHPFWTGGDSFSNISEITDKIFMSSIKELSGLKSILCEDFIKHSTVLETYCKGFLYPRGNNSKVGIIGQRDIREMATNSTLTQADIGKKYNCSQHNVSYIIRNKRRPKRSIPKKINLDYDFGLILGYYASEGSIYSNGNGVEFALDEHKDTEYQKQLFGCIKNKFGFDGKQYGKNSGVSRISINSRLVADIIKKICPGNCYVKLVDHDILFSNKELLKGFIVGMFNGDGHINDKFATMSLTNLNLVNQVKMAVGVFGVNCSLCKPKREKTGYINGKKVNFAQPYKINISGNEYRKFMKIFYNKELTLSTRKQFIDTLSDISTYKIRNKELIDYNDYVYNLEVEEDNSYSTLNSTVHNCFSTDSNGFFSRKLIEACVASPSNPIHHASCGEIFYEASLHGHPQKKYIYGIDPASEIDNFSIVVIELNGDHNRIVYGWTTNRAQHVEIVKAGLVSELDYYSYCAKKIRWLMTRFPCERIMMDSQGGGIPVMEALHDPDKFDAEQGDLPIWPVTDPLKPQMTDAKAGLHIVELVNFASATWTEEANHGMRKDLEDKVLLFPYFDAITVANASISDDLSKVSYDTLEDCVMDIEELKDELSTIIISQTTSGRDKWDTPEIKMPGGKKGRLRKDRYSALVMANMGARQFMRTPSPFDYDSHGGFAGKTKYDSGSMYAGNEEFDRWARDFYGE